MNYDIITTYFPSFAELADADIKNMRDRLSAILHAAYPDIDFRPGTAAGDLVLTPFAHLACAQEIAMNRFLSDLDLANVAQGIIFNCDYVTRYLKNFAVYAQDTLQSTGVVRLTFTADQAYEIDRRAQYQFGTDTFQLRLPDPGPMEILAVGIPREAGVNSRNLVELTPGVYVVDVPVTGVMTSQISAGDSGTTDYPITQMSAINALADFDFGLPPSSLAVLAQKTRDTFYSCTPNTRGGAAAFLQKEFPQLVGNSPVLNGDQEMMRATVNALGLTNGALDLYVQSSQTVVETQVIKVPYFSGQGGGRFIVKLALANIPFSLDSVTSMGAPTLILEDIVTFSRSQSTQAPMASCAYSGLEDLWLTIGMPRDGSSNPLIPVDIDEDSNQSGLFTLVYRYDPLLPPIIDLMTSAATTPPGVSTLTKGFVPLFIDSMTVNYRRLRGMTVLVDQARTEILAYVNNLAYPRVYANTKVADSMFYAGASDVVSIDIQAHLQWSVGQRILTPAAPDPTTYAGALSGSYLPHPISINGSQSLQPVYNDVNIGTGSATFEACGPRNVVLVLPTTNLFFSEVN
jgi:hypothetical protein